MLNVYIRLGANVAGSQLKVIKQQMENWFKTSYVVERVNDAESHGVAVQVDEGRRIDWLKDEPQDDVLPGFDNWVEFGERFIEKVVFDNPVPASLEALFRLGKSPIALDTYLWVTSATCSNISTMTMTSSRLGGTLCTDYPGYTGRNILDAWNADERF